MFQRHTGTWFTPYCVASVDSYQRPKRHPQVIDWDQLSQRRKGNAGTENKYLYCFFQGLLTLTFAMVTARLALEMKR